MPHKILVFTDLHILPEGESIIGLDPSRRLAAVLEHAATHHGTRSEYERLAPLLADCPWPISFMIGNHDDRATFRSAFPQAATDPNGFVQSVLDFDDMRLILLDTVDPDASPVHSGRLCDARLAWLDDALATADGRACLIFMHHPPFAAGMDGMDRIALQDAAAFRARLSGTAATHIFAGHIHRTIQASIGGLPITVFKSPCHQMPLRLGASTEDDSVDEPGGYGVILCTGSDVVVHFADVGLP